MKKTEQWRVDYFLEEPRLCVVRPGSFGYGTPYVLVRLNAMGTRAYFARWEMS